MKIVFPYLAQLHQIPHTLPIAMAIAAAHPDIKVHLCFGTQAQLDFARKQHAFYKDAPVQFDLLKSPFLPALYGRLRGSDHPPKIPFLFHNRHYFRNFDAIIVPERTSLFLRRLGLGKTRLIWTGHGAGDREHGFTKDIGEFDFVLVAGEKSARRMLENGAIRPGHYAQGIYAKFGLVEKMSGLAPRLFDNERPIIVYNPHFRPHLSSWPKMGFGVLDYFAANPQYNFVFAPHLRLFDPPRPARYRPFARYMDLPHMRIDLGSLNSIDMTYTLGADLYLGDVSSQLAEFMVRPRPCVFLNPDNRPWRGDPNYRSWTLGPVVDDLRFLGQALEQAFAAQPHNEAAQKRYFEETFGADALSSAHRGAAAIVTYLRGTAAAG